MLDIKNLSKKRGIRTFSKRGQAKSLWAFIGTVLAGVLILFSIYVIITLTGVLRGPSAKDQAAVSNFNFLTDKITEFIDKPEQFNSFTIEKYQIPSDYILVGFDKDWFGDMEDPNIIFSSPHGTIFNGKAEANWCGDGEGIEKPKQCLGKACLCLYTAGKIADDFMEAERNPEDVVTPCITFSGDISILGQQQGYSSSNEYLNDGAEKYPEFRDYYPDSSGYEFLVIYGKCKDSWGIKSMYIEKFVNTEIDKTYIFLAHKSNTITKREEWLKDKYPS